MFITENRKVLLMNRNSFLKTVIKYILSALLAFIALALGTKVVTGANCSSCAGKGICSGESDCVKYLK
jgi:hypothetical protein